MLEMTCDSCHHQLCLHRICERNIFQKFTRNFTFKNCNLFSVPINKNLPVFGFPKRKRFFLQFAVFVNVAHAIRRTALLSLPTPLPFVFASGSQPAQRDDGAAFPRFYFSRNNPDKAVGWKLSPLGVFPTLRHPPP